MVKTLSQGLAQTHSNLHTPNVSKTAPKQLENISSFGIHSATTSPDQDSSEQRGKKPKAFTEAKYKDKKNSGKCINLNISKEILKSAKTLVKSAEKIKACLKKRHDEIKLKSNTIS